MTMKFRNPHLQNMRMGGVLPKQKGFRAVRHSFSKDLTTEGGGTALAVLPVLPGETVRDLNITHVWSNTDQGQASSTHHHDTYEIVLFLLSTDLWTGSAPNAGSANSSWDSEITRVIEANSNVEPYMGDPDTAQAEPMHFGDVAVNQNIEILLSEDRIVTSRLVGNGYTDTTIKFDLVGEDRFKWSLRKPVYSRDGGVLVYGLYKHNVVGATAIDLAITDWAVVAEDFREILDEPYADLAAGVQKAYQMLYDGDQYHPQEYFVESSAEVVGKLQARIATPWPMVPQP